MKMKMSNIINEYDGSGDFAEWVQMLLFVDAIQKIGELENMLMLFLKSGAFSAYHILTSSEKIKQEEINKSLLKMWSKTTG